MTALPELDGVQHRFVDLGDGVTIHVAEAGPPEGPPVMLVHGFPQHWWEWRELIGPLAADGYRVLCPDLRGAGWSSAPAGAYRKNDMADDLAAVLDRLHVGPVTLVAHDWGGFVAFIMMLRHPAKVTGFFGLNTGAPWVRLDGPLIRHLWRFWYQIPLAFPVVGSANHRRFQSSLPATGHEVGGRGIYGAGKRLPAICKRAARSRARDSLLALVPHIPQSGVPAMAARRIRRRTRQGPGRMAARHRRSRAHTYPAARI